MGTLPEHCTACKWLSLDHVNRKQRQKKRYVMYHIRISDVHIKQFVGDQQFGISSCGQQMLEHIPVGRSQDWSMIPCTEEVMEKARK
jgi:hypothetical protein